MTKELFKQACIRYTAIPYRWGGDDPILGFDCSGLVQELLAMIGMDPAGDQNAQALYEHFKTRSAGISIDTGTLLFFGKTLSNITHVGMALDPITMIEAGGGGSKTISEAAAAEQNAWIRLRPIKKRLDLIGHLNPMGFPW